MSKDTSTPMRPGPGAEAPWYRLDRDLAHIGLGLLENAVQILPPTDAATSLGYCARQLDVDLLKCVELSDRLGGAIAREWFKTSSGLPAGDLPPGAPAVAPYHRTFDAAMLAAGWYDLPPEVRGVFHMALGELLLPMLFDCLRSEVRVGGDVPTADQLQAVFKLNQTSEKKARSIWSIRRWRNYFADFARRRHVSLWISKHQASE